MHRRQSSFSDSSTIDSEGESLAEEGYGPYCPSQRSHGTKAVASKNVYNSTAKDYSMIIREVEADYQAARKSKNRETMSDVKIPGSAGSGISADSGYASHVSNGPQVLVPNYEDLWG